MVGKKKGVFALGIVLAGSYSSAAIRFVDADAMGSGSGTSWANAHTSLYSALTLAQAGDQVWVAAGTYLATNGPFTVLSGVGLFGGFVGNESSLGQRNVATNLTLLSGDLLGDDAPGFQYRTDNAPNIVLLNNASAATTVDGFTIRGGTGPVNGNGLRSIGGSPTIQNCRLTSNLNTAGFGSNGGAGAFVSGGAARFLNCIFDGNATDFEDGAGLLVDLFASSIEVANCEFRNNVAGRIEPIAASAANGAGLYSRCNTILTDTSFIANLTYGGGGGTGSGAGAFIDAFTHTVSNCRFEANVATTLGGSLTQGAGLRAAATNLLQITGCTFQGNEINSPDGRGGGLWVLSSSDGRVNNCLVRDNRATAEGAGIWIQGHCNLTNSLISDNGASATLRGGGVYKLGSTGGDITGCHVLRNQAARGGGCYVTSGTINLRQSEVRQNVASEGGGVYSNLSQVSLLNALVAGNQATSSGGGLLVTDLATSRPLSVSFSTISSNQAPSNSNIRTQTTPAIISDSVLYFGTMTLAAGSTADRSVIAGGFPGSNLSSDPLFLSPATFDFRLSPGSPAIDFADGIGAPPSDLQGSPRSVDGNLDASAIPDAGCLEFRPAYTSAYDFVVVEGELFDGNLNALLESDDSKISIFNDPYSLTTRVRMLFALGGLSVGRASANLETSVARPGLALEVRFLSAQTGLATFLFGRVAATGDTLDSTIIPPQHIQGSVNTWIETKWFPLNDEDPSADGWLHHVDHAYILSIPAP